MKPYKRESPNVQDAKVAIINLLDAFKKNSNTIMKVYFSEDDNVITC